MADEEAWSAWRGGAVKQVSQHPRLPTRLPGAQELSHRWTGICPLESFKSRSVASDPLSLGSVCHSVSWGGAVLATGWR